MKILCYVLATLSGLGGIGGMIVSAAPFVLFGGNVNLEPVTRTAVILSSLTFLLGGLAGIAIFGSLARILEYLEGHSSRDRASDF